MLIDDRLSLALVFESFALFDALVVTLYLSDLSVSLSASKSVTLCCCNAGSCSILLMSENISNDVGLPSRSLTSPVISMASRSVIGSLFLAPPSLKDESGVGSDENTGWYLDLFCEDSKLVDDDRLGVLEFLLFDGTPNNEVILLKKSKNNPYDIYDMKLILHRSMHEVDKTRNVQ